MSDETSEPEVVEAEIVEEPELMFGDSTSDEERRIRVYDQRGDFIITIPPKATLSFGYFNPAASGERYSDQRAAWGSAAEGRNTFKTTCLRVRTGGEKSPQLACFLGVSGFRDESIKLTRLSQRVVIETGYTNDGDGNVDAKRSERRQLVAAPEPDTYQ